MWDTTRDGYADYALRRHRMRTSTACDKSHFRVTIHLSNPIATGLSLDSSLLPHLLLRHDCASICASKFILPVTLLALCSSAKIRTLNPLPQYPRSVPQHLRSTVQISTLVPVHNPRPCTSEPGGFPAASTPPAPMKKTRFAHDGETQHSNKSCLHLTSIAADHRRSMGKRKSTGNDTTRGVSCGMRCVGRMFHETSNEKATRWEEDVA